jgi:hypothetical protein
MAKKKKRSACISSLLLQQVGHKQHTLTQLHHRTNSNSALNCNSLLDILEIVDKFYKSK